MPIDDTKLIIETGVDKLVKLINEKKKISIQEAAKQLGMSLVVVEEWADFLEEEGVISIEYKFTTPYLVVKESSKKEIEVKAKEFKSKKDSFVRKSEVTLSYLDKNSEIFGTIQNEFDLLKDNLQGGLGKIKTDLKKMEQFEAQKRNIDKEIREQEALFKDKIQELDSQIIKEQKKYASIIQQIKAEDKNLESKQKETESIKDMEVILEKKVKEVEAELKKIEDKIKTKDYEIDEAGKHIKYLRNVAKEAKDDLIKNKKEIDHLLETSLSHEKEILKLQDNIIKKAKEKKDEINKEMNIEKAAKSFDKFFAKKSEIDSMLTKVNKDRDDLRKDLVSLIKSAKAFNLSTSSSKFKVEAEAIQKRYATIEKKKKLFEDEVAKLTKIFR